MGGAKRGRLGTSSLLLLLLVLPGSICLAQKEEEQLLGHVANFENEIALVDPIAPPGSSGAHGPAAQAQVPSKGLETLPLTLIPEVGFVYTRAARLGPTRFVVCGYGSIRVLNLSDPSAPFSDVSCSWEDARDNRTYPGTLTVDPASPDPELPGVEGILFCDLNETDPNSNSGEAQDEQELLGIPSRDTTFPGTLHIRVGTTTFSPYKQEDTLEVHRVGSKGPFPKTMVYCSGPIFGDVHPNSITQWIQYHLFLAPLDRLYLYSLGGITEDMVLSHLLPLMDSGLLTVVNHSAALQPPYKDYLSHYFNQVVLMTDCSLRHREDASWIFFSDLDEYLDITLSPPMALKALLAREEAKGTPCISRDQLPYPFYCESEGRIWDLAARRNKFAVELVDHSILLPPCYWNKSIEGPCEFCSRRKLITNPRMVEKPGMHWVLRWAPGRLPPGLTFDIYGGLHHGHFSGITVASKECKALQAGDKEKLNYTQETIANTAAKARECFKFGNFLSKCEGSDFSS